VAGSLWLDYGAAAGTYAVSRAAGWDEAGRVAVRVLVALAATDAATGGLKVAFGRARPGADRPDGAPLDADRFDPVSFDRERRSLPSGHAARMFAVASTLDRELGDRAPWLPWVAYPVAGLTGAGRVIEREHWVTDVVSGGILGLLTSRVAGRVFRREEERTEGSSAPRPWAVARGDAVAVGITLPTP
jgi:membrane-associated phospholipid phosphatase